MDSDDDDETTETVDGQACEGERSYGQLHGLGGSLEATKDEKKIDLLIKSKKNFDKALEEASNKRKEEADGQPQSNINFVSSK